MLGQNLDDTLVDVNYDALYRMAEFFDKQATICRARAYDIQHFQDQEKRAADQIEFYKSTYRIVARYLRQGHDIDRAIVLTAEHTSVPAVTVRSWWDKFLADKQKKAVQQRNALAYEMAVLGVSNVSIAQRLNLHPVTVSKILKRERKKRIYNHNQERLALYPASRIEGQAQTDQSGNVIYAPFPAS